MDNTIITFHGSDGFFLQQFIEKLEQQYSSSLIFLKNCCTNEKYSTEYSYTFIENNEFNKQKKNNELISGDDDYYKEKTQYGVKFKELKNAIEYSKKSIMLNVSTKCKLAIKKALEEQNIKNTNFISILIEYTNEKCFDDRDETKSFKVRAQNKQNNEYNIIISSTKSKDELLNSAELRAEIFNKISEKIKEQSQQKHTELVPY